MSFVSVLFSMQGRIGRGQYWLGYLVLLAIAFIAWLVLFVGLGLNFDGQNVGSQNIILLFVPIVLAPFSLWMSICIMAKRYHDRGKSAWWILICLIPIVGGIWQFIELGLLRGDDGTNDYGPDPAFSFNVSGDIEALRSQAGYNKPTTVNRPAAVTAATARPQSRSPYTDGRPVFGKRV